MTAKPPSNQSSSIVLNPGDAARRELIKSLIEKCKITPQLHNYVAKFTYPYANDVISYELVQKIGQGTFGYVLQYFSPASRMLFRQVFKGRCKRTGKQVALKKIILENEKEGVIREF